MKKVLAGVVVGLLFGGTIVGSFEGVKYLKSKKASKKEKKLVEELKEKITKNESISLEEIEDFSYDSIIELLDHYRSTYSNNDAYIEKLEQLIKVDKSVDFLEFLKSYYETNDLNTVTSVILLELTTLRYKNNSTPNNETEKTVEATQE